MTAKPCGPDISQYYCIEDQITKRSVVVVVLNRFSFLLDKLTKGLVKKKKKKKTKAHVIIRLRRFFLLCFYLLLLTWAAAVEGAGPPAGGSQLLEQTPSLYIADEAPTVDTGQGLCKQARRERFNTDTSCADEGIDPILMTLTLSSRRTRVE